MKITKLTISAVSALVCMSLLSACGETLWYGSQLPGLKGISDRMNDRALQRRLSGDPLQELEQNTKQGDYRFRGFMDTDKKRTWAPGVPDGSYPTGHVEYLVTDHSQTWTPSAIRFFSTYNSALVSRRHGKKFDSYGILVR